MKVKLFLIALLLCIYPLQHIFAQHTVSGKVQDVKEQPLNNVIVVFMSQDTLVAGTVSDEKGEFQIKDLPDNDYLIRYSLLGYKEKHNRVRITGNSHLETVTLEEDPIALRDVEVSASRSEVVKAEAGKMTFFLSDPQIRN